MGPKRPVVQETATDDDGLEDMHSTKESPKFPFPPPDRFYPALTEATLLERANGGEARAQFDLGVISLNGAWTPGMVFRNLGAVRTALAWFSKAAEGGLGEAEFAYGVIEMTETGLISVKDACKCFEAAQRLGYAPAKDALEWVNVNYRLLTERVRR